MVRNRIMSERSSSSSGSSSSSSSGTSGGGSSSSNVIAITRQTQDGGEITVTKGGKVTIRDSKGNVVKRYYSSKSGDQIIKEQLSKESLSTPQPTPSPKPQVTSPIRMSYYNDPSSAFNYYPSVFNRSVQSGVSHQKIGLIDRANIFVSGYIKKFKSGDDYIIGGTKWIDTELQKSQASSKKLITTGQEVYSKYENKKGIKAFFGRAFGKIGIAMGKYEKATAPFVLGAEKGVREYIREKPVSTAGYFGGGFLTSGGITAGKTGLSLFSKSSKLGAVMSPIIKKGALMLGIGVTGAYGYQTGKEIMKEPTSFGKGQKIGQELTKVTAFVGGAKTYQSVHTSVLSKITKPKIIQSGKSEVLRTSDLKSKSIKEVSGMEAKVEVSKNVFGKKYNVKTYDVGISSKKSMTVGKSDYNYKSRILVKRDKGLDIYQSTGVGKIGMTQEALIKTPAKEFKIYSVGGKEQGVMTLSNKYVGLKAQKTPKVSQTSTKLYGGKLYEKTYNVQTVDGITLKLKYPKGTAKTDYIISERLPQAKSLGSTAQVRTITDYKFMQPTKSTKIEFGSGVSKGITFKGVIPNQELVQVYNYPSQKWSLMDKSLLSSKKGQFLISRPTTLKPSKITVPKGSSIRPPTTLMGEAMQSAKMSYLLESSPSKFIIFPKLSSSTKPQSRLIPSSEAIIKPTTEPTVKKIPQYMMIPQERTIQRTRLIQKPITSTTTTTTPTIPITPPPSTITPLPPPTKSPPVIPPMFEFNLFQKSKKSKSKYRKTKFKTKYFPSVEALFRNIKGKKLSKRRLAIGLNLRPIPK